MKERPILMSTPMVLAILEGRKTQTRRVIKFPKNYDLNLTIGWEVRPHKDTPELFSLWWETKYTLPAFRCPYGKIGDILWAKETFRPIYKDIRDMGSYQLIDTVIDYYEYKADKQPQVQKIIKWKPSIYMPKEACRIKLEITNIRVELLQDISEDDAVAEGINEDKFATNADIYNYVGTSGTEHMPPAKFTYKELWESINGKGSWQKNPWVWVIEFKRI